MTATLNRLLLGLATMMASWVFALYALHDLSAWATAAGLAFLLLVGLGITRAARI